MVNFPIKQEIVPLGDCHLSAYIWLINTSLCMIHMQSPRAYSKDAMQNM